MAALALPANVYEMADDNMEISYDGPGDDDIDINIDIEPENQDEDFIIEDAVSEHGSINDDEMLDEDSSYLMEDAEVPEHDLQDVDAETVEVTEVQASDLNVADADIQSSEVTMNQDAQPTEVDVTNNAVEPVEDQPILAQPVQSPSAAANTEKLPSPPRDAAQQETAMENSLHVTDDSDAQGANAIVQEAEPKRESMSLDREVVVLYNDTEYALVSSSEYDDPNSYFVKDPSTLAQPMRHLLETIRGILSDEVSEVDELFLAVDDLGLEIGEVCTISLCPS